MGQKTNPIAFRLTDNKSPANWPSRWFSSKGKYPEMIKEDLEIRKFLESRLEAAGLMTVQIERLTRKVRITLFTSRPGMVIGRGGKGLEEIKKALSKVVSVVNPDKNLDLEVEEVKNQDLSAKLVAQRIVYQLEKRIPFRRVVKKTLERVMMSGAVGARIVVKGRIDGAEIARSETFSAGRVSLSTIRADIDYAEVPALTKSGYVGIRVYINRGER
jgi:small subunit ribosomal protein S3